MAKTLKIAFVCGLVVLWVVSVPVVVLGIGFSGGEILNPLKLISDLVRGDTYFLNRLLALTVVITPLVLLGLVVRNLRRKRQAGLK
ncbi:MAG TPA: hypothetical protein VF637_11495 [Sphingomicrobium sp.]|jgi:uncharacterized membrane protein